MDHGKVGLAGFPVMKCTSMDNIVSHSGMTSLQFSVPALGGAMIAIAPTNFTLGAVQTGTYNTTSLWTTSAETYLQPVFLQNFLGSATFASTASISMRYAGLCAKLTNLSPLSAVTGLASARRFQSPYRMTTLSGSATSVSDGNFLNTQSAVLNDAIPITGADLVSTRCVKCFPRNLAAMDMAQLPLTPLGSGALAASEWRANYVAASDSATDAYPYCPWLPTIMFIDNTGSSVAASYSLSVEYVIQVEAMQNSFLSAFSSKVPRGIPVDFLTFATRAAQHLWEHEKTVMSRDVKPYLGAALGAKSRKRNPAKKPKNGNNRAPNPRTYAAQPRPPKVYSVRDLRPPRVELRRAQTSMIQSIADRVLPIAANAAGAYLRARRAKNGALQRLQ